MNVERIRDRLRNGFRPFAVVTSSGEKYPVPHSEFIAVSSKVEVVTNERGSVFILDPLHIVSLDEWPPIT